MRPCPKCGKRVGDDDVACWYCLSFPIVSNIRERFQEYLRTHPITIKTTFPKEITMSHDKNGTELKKGDIVAIHFHVEEVFGDSDACNVNLRSTINMPAGDQPLKLAAVNTKQTVLLTSALRHQD